MERNINGSHNGERKEYIIENNGKSIFPNRIKNEVSSVAKPALDQLKKLVMGAIMNKISNSILLTTSQFYSNKIDKYIVYKIALNPMKSIPFSLRYDHAFNRTKIDSFDIDNFKFKVNIESVDSIFLCKDKKTICKVELVKYQDAFCEGSDSSINRFKITFIGKNAYLYSHKILCIIKKCSAIPEILSAKNKNVTYIRQIFKNNSGSTRCKPIDKIVLDNKYQLIDSITNFINNKDIFNKFDVRHKYGIIFYGEPGCGKTSIIRSIIFHLTRSIPNLNIQAMYLDLNTSLDRIKSSIDSITDSTESLYVEKDFYIIVLEEIDCIMNKRFDSDGKSNDSADKVNTLLQFLDGYNTPNTSTLFLATTNHLDKLDPALIRDGRFDQKIEVKPFNLDQAKEMCDNFEVDYSILEEFGENDSIIPSTLQNMIFSKIYKNKIVEDQNRKALEDFSM